jgi:hypothetical protein
MPVAYLVKIFPEFMEVEDLFPCLQEPTIGPCPESVDFRPHPIQLRTILMLTSRLCLNIPSGIFRSGFRLKSDMNFSTPPLHILFPVHLSYLDMLLLLIFSEELKLWSSSTGIFLHPSITCRLFVPNILSGALLWKILNLFYTIMVRNQILSLYTVAAT